MKIETVSIDTIKPFDKNPRVHSDIQVSEMAKSISKFGQIRPVVVDENNTILVGHCIRLALLKLGMDKVEVLRKLGMSETEKKKLVLADNKIGDLGSDDFDKVMSLISELEDFDIPGFNAKVLDELLASSDHALDSYGSLPAQESPAESNFFAQAPNAPDQSTPAAPGSSAVVPPAESRRIVRCPYCGGEIEV